MESSNKLKSFEQRLEQTTNIQAKYPDRVCIYIEKHALCKSLPAIDKNKFLVPNSITAAQFIYVIRKKIVIPSQQALFLYVNNTIISGNTRMIEIGNKHIDNDGFIYIKYSGENCFGSLAV